VYIEISDLVCLTEKTPQPLEINRLVKGRPLDNLEFLQWLKRFCDSINGGIMNEYVRFFVFANRPLLFSKQLSL